MKPLPLLTLPLFLLVVASAPSPDRDTPARSDVDRSPIDVALVSENRALSVNHTAGTVSLVDLATGKVLDEKPVGERPFALALTPDGKSGGTLAFVTNNFSDDVSPVRIQGETLTVMPPIPVGDEPRGIAFSSDGKRAFVSLGGEEAVAVLDTTSRKVVGRWSVGLEPWHLAVTPDGGRLVVANTRSRTATVLDTATGQEKHSVKVLGRNLRHISVSSDGKWAYFPAISERGLGVTKENIDRGWVVGNRLARVPLLEKGPREAITLDIRQNAVGDVDGTALRPDGQQIALTAGGTHELLLLRLPDLPFIAYGGPGDHLDEALENNPERFRRVKLGGRPRAVRYTPDGKRLIVANYLKNAVQVVDSTTGNLVQTIALGGAKEPTLARRGEAIFTDADRSFGSWYSCYTCHTEGHTNGGNFDTLNDGGLGLPKKTISLRGMSETAPYTWHGWQENEREALRESLKKTMQGPEPTEEDLDAVAAYLKTVTFRPSPYRNSDGSLTEAAKRGEQLFDKKLCNGCHAPPNYTSSQVVKVGLESPGDAFPGFNPPTLRGLYARAPYLHDGRAKTLESLLTEHHTPAQLTGKPDCTPGELADLIAFLKSL